MTGEPPSALPWPILYARLLAAERNGEDWRDVARNWLMLDPDADETGAEAAWREMLETARVYWVGAMRPESGSD